MKNLIQGNLSMVLLCLLIMLMASCTKEDLLSDNDFPIANTYESKDVENTSSKSVNGDNENDNSPDVVLTLNDEDNNAMVEYLIIMTHDNRNDDNNGDGNDNSSYSAYTIDTGVAILENLDSGNYTIEIFDEEGNFVYTTSTTVNDDREVIRIVLS